MQRTMQAGVEAPASTYFWQTKLFYARRLINKMTETQAEPPENGGALRTIGTERERMARKLRTQLVEDTVERRANVGRLLSEFHMRRTSHEATVVCEEPSGEQLLRIVAHQPTKGMETVDIRDEMGAPQKTLSNAPSELTKKRKVARKGSRYHPRREGQS